MNRIFFFAIFFLTACSNRQPERLVLKALHRTSLREAPGETSRETGLAAPGERLIDLGGVSDFSSTIYIGGANRDAPWLLVRTAKGKQAWVFAASVEPENADSDAWMLEKQMRCHLGAPLTERRNQWALKEKAIITDVELARYFRQASGLRDTLLQQLMRPGTNPLPDFHWLGGVLPGFVCQQISEDGQPYFFTDYRYWNQRARQTSGEQDDHFFQFCLEIYPTDSIESFFPCWMIQTGLLDGCSQLGTGQHLKVLKKLDALWLKMSGFLTEIQGIKDLVLEDILAKNVCYWQPKEKILAELNQIIASDFQCLNDRDRLALQGRVKMFEQPFASGIRLNVRSGLAQ